ncbi:MAG: hypothetical protein IKW61_03710 [Bacteroidaceae bacterium]|nr:hypothetical protein [Bacteroidaceae bacterium]
MKKEIETFSPEEDSSMELPLSENRVSAGNGKPADTRFINKPRHLHTRKK